MTALQAYALAKKIAISAVSGIRNLSVNGTTLIIETTDGNTLEMVFPIPADGRGIQKTEINSQNHLIVTYDDGVTEDAGPIGSNVDVTQLLTDGIKIASITIGDKTTDLFAPKNSESDYYIIDDSSNLPDDLTEEERKIYFCIDDGNFHIWNGNKWESINIGGVKSYLELSDKPKINGVTLEGDKSSADIGLGAVNLADGSTIIADDNGKLKVGIISDNDIDSLFL